MKNKYNLYALIKNGQPIYIGVSCSIRTRISKHKKDKDFDYHIIIKKYPTKEKALCAENSIIRFNGLFSIGLINAMHEQDQIISQFHGFKPIK